MNNPTKWPGGKNYLAKKIVALMPPHLTYVEPYCGSCAVLFEHPCEGVSEVVNDLHMRLTQFWAVLADERHFAQFVRHAQAKPFSEVSFASSLTMTDDLNRFFEPWEMALSFFVRCRQSHLGSGKSFAGLTRNRVRRGMNEQVSAWLTAVDGLPEVHARLRRVLILNRDALDVIRQFDAPTTLFYLDPPYLHETRNTKANLQYEHEMTVEQHKDLLEVLGNVAGKFMLSGYPHRLYDTFADLSGWHRLDFDLPNNMQKGAEKRRMVERLWANFPLQET